LVEKHVIVPHPRKSLDAGEEVVSFGLVILLLLFREILLSNWTSRSLSCRTASCGADPVLITTSPFDLIIFPLGSTPRVRYD
jgi:hypothetical protein